MSLEFCGVKPADPLLGFPDNFADCLSRVTGDFLGWVRPYYVLGR